VKAAAAAFEWQTAAPESAGMSSAKLDALKESLARRKTTAFLVVRNDRIVYEWYAPGRTAAMKNGTASLAKATIGGLSLGVALTDGLLALDDPAAKYVPEWRADPGKSRITLRQLGSHTSGLEDAEVEGLPHDRLPGWKGEFWKRLDPPRDPFTLARDEAPMLFDPGAKLSYSNPGIGMLTYAVTAALRDAPVKDVRTLLRERIMRPLGVADADWSCGYNQTFTVDHLPLVGSWGGAAFTPRALARVGRLILRQGEWDGKQLLSPKSVREIAGDAGLPGHCGMGWWTNADRRYPRLPADVVYGAGAGDQLLLVIPSLHLIMVRNGEPLEPPPAPDGKPRDVFARSHDARARLLFEPLVEAVTAAPAVEPRPSGAAAPYPPSTLVRSLTWAPKESIVRKAPGSDNWPLTWADDGHLYTAYGDGTGFEPPTRKKLSLGFARIEGDAVGFTGTNLPAPTLEQLGDGRSGKKASGILMVEGVLYLWARNAGNSQLAWSRDHGKTWTWSDWKFSQSFGCPTFLNFGPNYAGARDRYVYTYSPDQATAYDPADRMLLARVPRDQIRDRSAYEFFRGTDPSGRPTWTRNIEQRGAVFTHPGKCYRSGVTYNAGLKRYLWCQTLPTSKGGSETGFGIFEAPEPWGPWSTVFYTEAWDVPVGETCSFPTKWISADGRTLHLVFAGGDSFAVRQATLETNAPTNPRRP
jgi:CubicO group peptidase (beta-lactamase class C family)